MRTTSSKNPNPTHKKTEVGESGGFVKDVSKELLKEAGVTLKWGLYGAIFGAILLGGIGVWKFGSTGLWIGALAGSLVGGVGAIVLYTMGNSFTT